VISKLKSFSQVTRQPSVPDTATGFDIVQQQADFA
jgi:hypothetical protein